MSYLRMECPACYFVWNYFDEKILKPELETTAIPYLGSQCPKCGTSGLMPMFHQGEELSHEATIEERTWPIYSW